jgi:tetratricopeptide (TPR) repeat protein
VDAPKDVPLNDAVDQGLIPCSRCGARGAGVSRAEEGRPHFLCRACAKRRRPLFVYALIAMLAMGLAAWLLSPKRTTRTDWFTEADTLLRAGKTREARKLLEAQAELTPDDARVRFFLGQSLLALGAVEKAREAFATASAADPQAVPVNRLWEGICLQQMGHSADALPLLQATDAGPAFEKQRVAKLVDCLLDLERYDAALALLGDDPDRLWERHRALRYSGKAAEAEALLGRADPKIVWGLRATQLREEGKFEEARAVIDARRKETPDDGRLERAAFALAVEAHDLPRLEAARVDPKNFGESLWAVAVARLTLGRREQAVAAAKEFLAHVDPELTSLRLERLQLRFLAGTSKLEEIEAEIRKTSRARANDLYWFLALATGERAWAEKGLASTPGKNFPYHALARLAAK